MTCWGGTLGEQVPSKLFLCLKLLRSMVSWKRYMAATYVPGAVSCMPLTDLMFICALCRTITHLLSLELLECLAFPCKHQAKSISAPLTVLRAYISPGLGSVGDGVFLFFSFRSNRQTRLWISFCNWPLGVLQRGCVGLWFHFCSTESSALATFLRQRGCGTELWKGCCRELYVV